MKERIVDFYPSNLKNKKYTVIVEDKKTKRTRTIQFGARSYEQYKDSSPIKKYSRKDHGDAKRRRNYFSRHSGVTTKREAMIKELKKSNGRYNAKILSHKYLW